MGLFSAETYKRRQESLAQLWISQLSANQAIIVFSGNPIQKPGGLDQTYPFLPHPSYFWLTGRRRQGEFSVFLKNEGWFHFQNPLSDSELIWESGQIEINSKWTIHDFPNWVQKNSKIEFVCFGTKADQMQFQVSTDQNLFFNLKKVFDQLRRKKDSEEVQLIRQISKIAEVGYQKISENLQPGMTEKEIQVIYESAVLLAGSDKLPYESIVGTGTNSAILHATPSLRKIKSGDQVLIDAGADIEDYCVDITRIFYADKKPTSQQKELFDLVFSAHQKSIQMCKSKTQWKDVHLTAAQSMAQDLKQLGIIKVSAEEAVQTEAISVFFPHGVGHLVGLKVRDTGVEENLNPKMYAGARLRVDLELEAGHLLTVEPGCYFIPTLINSHSLQEKYKNQIDFEKASKWISVGGVRIEDDILIFDQGFENLTQNIPYHF